ncbi:MAG: hypothetical protein M1157_07540 [Deinococcus sp.]|nr:hypothetical protein [Deinococcus sp.]
MSQIPLPMLAAFRLIYSRLEQSGTNWVLTGSLAFAMQGLPLSPRDIDIQTDKEGAYRFGELFAEYVRHPVGPDRAGERIRSHLGDFVINGVQVQVMGALQKRTSAHREWEPPTDIGRHKCYVEFEGMKVPVLSLSYEAEAYRKMGREERADLIERFLKDG